MTNNNKRIAAIAATGITIVSPIAQTTTVFADEVNDAQTELKKAEEQAKAAEEAKNNAAEEVKKAEDAVKEAENKVSEAETGKTDAETTLKEFTSETNKANAEQDVNKATSKAEETKDTLDSVNYFSYKGLTLTLFFINHLKIDLLIIFLIKD